MLPEEQGQGQGGQQEGSGDSTERGADDYKSLLEKSMWGWWCLALWLCACAEVLQFKYTATG